MNKFLFVLFSFIVLTSYSQQSKIDSLKSGIYGSSNKEETMINIVRQSFLTNPILANSYCDSIINLKSNLYISEAKRVKAEIQLARMNYKNALLLIEEAIKIDSIDSNKFQLAKDYWVKGLYFNLTAKQNKALQFFEKAKINIENIENNKFKGILYADIAIRIHIFNKNSFEAIKILKKAKEFSLKAKDSFNVYYIEQNEFTLLKKTLKDYSGSWNLYNYSKRINNPYHIARSQIALGNSFGTSKDMDTLLLAKKYLDSAIVFFKKNKYNFFTQVAYARLSYIAKMQGDPNLELEYILKGYEAVKNSDSFFKEMTMYNLANLYLNKKEFRKAEDIFNQIIELDKEKNLQKILLELSYKGLSNIYELKKDYSQSLKYYKIYKNIGDKLYSTETSKQVNDYKIKYETQEKQKENLQLKANNVAQELQLEKENKRKWYFGIGLLASLITLSVFIFYFRRNKEQKTVIENLQKDLHHRVKNNLAIIDALIDDIKDEFDNEKFKTKLTELQNRIDSINEVHSQLYKNTDITNLKLKKYVEKLANNVQQSFAKDNIVIKQDIQDSLQLKVDKSFPVGLIINEFLTNSFKYAFDDDTKGIVSISIKEKAKTFLLTLSDNGKGLPKDFDISKLDSFGVDVMKLLSKQLKGTFSFDGSNGVNLNIEFPKG